MSDGFAVQPTALTAFAATLSSTGPGNSSALALDSEFLTTAQDYTNQWVKLEGGTGGLCFSGVVGTTDALAAQLTSNYSVISGLLGSSAHGLTASANQYRGQDHATAAHLDSIYKPSGVAPLTDEVDVSEPSVDAATKLTEPGDEGAFPDVAEQVLEGCAYVSISALALKLLTLLGLDVEEWIKERFAGDYKAVAKCRNAIKNLADFENAAATSIADGTATMLKSWQGSAATAAQGYFDQLADALASHGNALSALADKLDTLVIAIQQLGAAAIGWLTLLIDMGMELAAAVAAAGCLQEIPGVNALMDIIGAWKVVEVINKIRELGDMWGVAWASLQTLVGGTMTVVGALQTYTAPIKPPAVGYANASQSQQPEEDSTTPTGRQGPQ